MFMGKIILLVSLLFITGSSYITRPAQMVTIPVDIPKIKSNPYRQWNISYPVADKELHCMALNIYFESRGEILEGKFAVADVVMYRVNHHNYPNTPCEVIKKGTYVSWVPDMPVKYKCHFSWFCDRRSDIPRDTDSFNTAMYIADMVINDPEYIPVIDYALYYHARHVSPNWAEGEEVVAYLGNHLFY